MALSNLSAKNSPMIFPDPFTEYSELDKLFIPWYRKVDFFTANDDAWSFYCSLMISFKRVKNLWFNGSILLLANIYFTTFYSTIYNQNIEISNEKNINDIIKIQGDTIAKIYEKRHHEKSLKTEEQFYERNDSFIDPLAIKYRPVTDEQIEKIITMFYASSKFTKLYNALLNVICSFGGLLTLIMLLIITYQLSGLINFVYIIFWLYHIYNFRKFLKPTKYSLPNQIGYLKLYLYWDLFINICYQIPFETLHKADNTKNWQKIFGIYSFCYVDPDTKDIMFRNISVIVTKSLMFCLIILLDNMMQSSAYKHFWNEKLVYLQEISTTKARCLTYLYNNNKLRKIIKIQYDKEAMIQKIKTMKRQLHLWNKKYLSTEDVEKIRRQTMLAMADYDQAEEYQMRLRTDSPFKTKKDIVEDIKEEYSKSVDPGQSKILQKKESVMTKVTFMDIEDDMYTTDQYHIMEQEEALLNELKDDNLNWFVRFFNWLKRNYSNQMLLITSSNRLEAIENDLMHGKHRINTTLENKLLIKHYFDKDPESHRIKRLNSSMPERFRVENCDYTDEKNLNLNRFQISTIIGMFISNSSILCYFFMIFAHIINGSLISLVYPVSIFCYAIFEEIRPTKNYWKFIMFYTMTVLVMKSVVKFFFISDYIPNSLNEFFKNFRIGIETVNSDSFPTNYYIFEVLIMLFVVMHMVSLIFQGLWDEREIGFETIDEAAHRITNYNKKLFKDDFKSARRHQTEKPGIILPRSCSVDLVEYYSDDGFEEPQNISFDNQLFDDIRVSTPQDPKFTIKIDDDDYLFRGRFEKTLASRWRNVENLRGLPRSRIYFGEKNIRTPKMIDADLNLFDKEVSISDDKIFMAEPPRALTEYIYEEINFEEAEEFINNEIKEAGILKTYWGYTKQRLIRNKYFKRLFPSVSAQKPGKDYYVPMAMIQFFIVIYIIVFFSFMERDYTTISSQKLVIRQFSALLVIAAFLQIFIMLLDRYIYISKTFVRSEDINDDENDKANESSDDNNTQINKKISSTTLERSPKKYIDITSRNANTILTNIINQVRHGDSRSYVKARKSDLIPTNDEDAEYEYTKNMNDSSTIASLNTSIRLKYILQWVLVIFVHLVVFWYLPSKSNNNSQGHYYCNYDEKAIKVEWNEVKENLYLIFFYLLYCLYFYFSALQIWYGYPELKKGNFLMANTTPINRIAFQVFLAVPFLLELKIFTDWSFTRTGLDVFQWFKFENIYGDLFIAKCINKTYMRHKLGDQIPKYMKFLVGILGTIGLVAVIAGPLLLFSSLNPIAEDNFVNGAKLDLSIEVNVTYDADITNKYVLFH